MKNLLILFSLFFTFVLPAQNLKVTVRSAEEPLPYATIFVNGIPAVVADAEGAAFLATDRLQPGDTISSSYLGFESTFAVYDDKMQDFRLCTLVHSKEVVYELEPAIITGTNNSREMF